MSHSQIMPPGCCNEDPNMVTGTQLVRTAAREASATVGPGLRPRSRPDGTPVSARSWHPLSTGNLLSVHVVQSLRFKLTPSLQGARKTSSQHPLWVEHIHPSDQPIFSLPFMLIIITLTVIPLQEGQVPLKSTRGSTKKQVLLLSHPHCPAVMKDELRKEKKISDPKSGDHKSLQHIDYFFSGKKLCKYFLHICSTLQLLQLLQTQISLGEHFIDW